MYNIFGCSKPMRNYIFIWIFRLTHCIFFSLVPVLTFHFRRSYLVTPIMRFSNQCSGQLTKKQIKANSCKVYIRISQASRGRSFLVKMELYWTRFTWKFSSTYKLAASEVLAARCSFLQTLAGTVFCKASDSFFRSLIIDIISDVGNDVDGWAELFFV